MAGAAARKKVKAGGSVEVVKSVITSPILGSSTLQPVHKTARAFHPP